MLRLLALPLALALAAFALHPAGGPPGAAGIEGSYTLTGSNADGTAYTGTLAVSRRGAVYQFSWAAGAEYEGIGVLRGDFVAVGFGGEGCGVAAYALSDGVLEGVWGLYGNEATGTERAVRTGGTGPAPTGAYAVSGINPDGSRYEGRLDVAARGDAFGLAWDAGGAYGGVGLRGGDALAASWGDGCGVAAYRVGPDGALVGRWTAVGLDGVGTERAVRP